MDLTEMYKPSFWCSTPDRNMTGQMIKSLWYDIYVDNYVSIKYFWIPNMMYHKIQIAFF